MANNATERNFWSAMVTAVSTASDLSYVAKWIDGARDRVFIPLELPAVIFQPIRVTDQVTRLPNKANAGIVFRVIGVLRVTDIDKSIAGDDTNTGILKLDEDLKNALDNHLTSGAQPRVYEMSTIEFSNEEVSPAGATQLAILRTVIEVTIEQALSFNLGSR